VKYSRTLTLSLILIFLCSNEVLAQRFKIPDFKKIQDSIENEQKKAASALKNAEEAKKAEAARRKAAKEASQKDDVRRAEEAKKAAAKEQARIQAINKAEILKKESESLIDKNTKLNLELQKQKEKLEEFNLQLASDEEQLQFKKTAYDNSLSALENEKLILEKQKDYIENRAFLYSMGFWTSIGAIALGCVTIVLRLPTMMLEREKLRKEILLLAQQLPSTAGSD